MKNITGYECEHCGKKSFDKEWVLKHEQQWCHKNKKANHCFNCELDTFYGCPVRKGDYSGAYPMYECESFKNRHSFFREEMQALLSNLNKRK